MTDRFSSAGRMAPPSADIGSVVGDRYRLVRFLGRGTMGVVFEAEHLRVGRRVAIKVLSHEWANDARMSKRFSAEARAASAAGHPNIIEVFDAGELEDGRPYIVMEHLNGQEVLEILRAEGSLETGRACRIVRAVARALDAAHEVGIVHRDLKAENVFVIPGTDGAPESVKVLDFGIAASGDVATDRMTTPGIAVGTPEYMAPEQAFGGHPTPRFDIYAMGVLLFELLTGEPPFVAEEPVKVLGIKAATPAPSLRERHPDAPPALVALVADCLAIDPEDRPASSATIADRLGEILEELEQPDSAVTAAPAPSVLPQRAPRRSVATMTFVSLAVAATLVTIGLWPEPRALSTAGLVFPGLDAEPPTRPAPPDLARTSVPVAATPDPSQPAPPAAAAEPTPKPKRRASPKPRPASKPKPKTETRPTSTPKASAAACDRERQRAHDARAIHHWKGTLRHTAESACWTSALERKRLRVQALLELGRFAACEREAGDSTDPHIVRWVTVCKRRREE